jgi:hypothetical protein
MDREPYQRFDIFTETLEWIRLGATGEFERCDPPVPAEEYPTPASKVARKAFKSPKPVSTD